MAIENKRPAVQTHFYFEANLAAGEVLVVPTAFHTRRNGDFRMAIQARAGTTLQATLVHPQTVAQAIPQGQRFTSTVKGDYPADADAGKNLFWSVGVTVAADYDIALLEQPGTALRIVAPAGGTYVIIHGDF